MNKRSALLIAAALVGVLAIGGAAFSMGLTGPTASAAAGRATNTNQKPLISTHTKTVVVHRQAPGAAPTIVQVSSSNSGSNSGPSLSSGPGRDGTDDGIEDDHGDHEGQDDQGDHEGQDQHGDDDV